MRFYVKHKIGVTKGCSEVAPESLLAPSELLLGASGPKKKKKTKNNFNEKPFFFFSLGFFSSSDLFLSNILTVRGGRIDAATRGWAKNIDV